MFFCLEIGIFLLVLMAADIFMENTIMMVRMERVKFGNIL